MNNVILRKVTVTAVWQPLNANRLVGSVTVSAAPGNANNVLIRTVDDPANEVPLVPGEWHELHRIDLSRIELQGEAGDLLTAVGGTW